MQTTFTLNDFLIAIATLTLVWSLFMFFHKRGLKNEERKRDEHKKQVDTKLDMDFGSAYWPDRSL